MPIPTVTSTGMVLPTKWLKPLISFFVSVLEHLPKVDPSILSSLTNYCSIDFVIFPEKVEQSLEKINIYKAPGPDGLPSWLLRDFAPYICEPLAAIYNASSREVYVPQIWKATEVIPVPKKPRPRHISTNLRPISLLPCIAKVLESLVGEWFLPVLNPTFDPNQFGCRGNWSTTHALAAMAHERQSALDQRAAVRVVLVDFKKAFDSANHNILLNKFYEKNIPHCLIKWFVSYLQHRTQRASLGSDL